jgi:hypothetical protein
MSFILTKHRIKHALSNMPPRPTEDQRYHAWKNAEYEYTRCRELSDNAHQRLVDMRNLRDTFLHLNHDMTIYRDSIQQLDREYVIAYANRLNAQTLETKLRTQYRSFVRRANLRALQPVQPKPKPLQFITLLTTSKLVLPVCMICNIQFQHSQCYKTLCHGGLDFGHTFCKDCYSSWNHACFINNRIVTCPICRASNPKLAVILEYIPSPVSLI